MKLVVFDQLSAAVQLLQNYHNKKYRSYLPITDLLLCDGMELRNKGKEESWERIRKSIFFLCPEILREFHKI